MSKKELERAGDLVIDIKACPVPALPPELAPQPPPANPPRGEPVWPLVIAEAEAGGEDPRLVALMRARHAQGVAKYGVPLCTHDGRNTAMDALQEAIDLVAYLRKRAQERGVGDYWTSGALDAARIARGLLDEIAVDPDAYKPPPRIAVVTFDDAEFDYAETFATKAEARAYAEGYAVGTNSSAYVLPDDLVQLNDELQEEVAAAYAAAEEALAEEALAEEALAEVS